VRRYRLPADTTISSSSRWNQSLAELSRCRLPADTVLGQLLTVVMVSLRRPAQLGKLLGVQIENSDIECDGLGVRATWMGNPGIQAWGLCWRDAEDGYVEIACSIMLKGCMLPGHGSVMNVIEKGPNVHVMICLLPIRDADKQPDYIAVSLPWAKCNEEVCGHKSMENGMQFEGQSPVSAEEFMISWEVLNTNRIDRNNKADEAAQRGKKKAAPRPRKRKDAAAQAVGSEAGASSVDAGTDAQQTDAGDSSRRKRIRGKKSAAGEPSDGPKELVYTLDEALLRGNKLTTKTKDAEVDAIYKALETGLMHAFPYRHRRIPGLIHSTKLHIAPDELKYRKIIRDRLGQVSYTSPFTLPFPLFQPLSAGSRYAYREWYRLPADTITCICFGSHPTQVTPPSTAFANPHYCYRAGPHNLQGIRFHPEEAGDPRHPTEAGPHRGCGQGNGRRHGPLSC